MGGGIGWDWGEKIEALQPPEFLNVQLGHGGVRDPPGVGCHALASEASTFRMQSAPSQGSTAGLAVEDWEEGVKAGEAAAQVGGAERV